MQLSILKRSALHSTTFYNHSIYNLPIPMITCVPSLAVTPYFFSTPLTSFFLPAQYYNPRYNSPSSLCRRCAPPLHSRSPPIRFSIRTSILPIQCCCPNYHPEIYCLASLHPTIYSKQTVLKHLYLSSTTSNPNSTYIHLSSTTPNANISALRSNNCPHPPIICITHIVLRIATYVSPQKATYYQPTIHHTNPTSIQSQNTPLTHYLTSPH